MKRLKFSILILFISAILIILIFCSCDNEYDGYNEEHEIRGTSIDSINTEETIFFDFTEESITEQTFETLNIPEKDETETTAKNIEKEFNNMKKILESYGDNITVFYKDCISGEEYYYNKEKTYILASVIKAPYAVYLYRSALESKCDLDEQIEYKRGDTRYPDGMVNETKFGTLFTVEELIGYSLNYSDNTAFHMLENRFGYEGFKNYLENEGLILKKGMTVDVNSLTDIECMVFYLEKVYEFIEEKNIYSERLKEHMLDTEMQVIKADYPVVRKYGFIDNDMSEIGIIYNEQRPYLLIIMTTGYYNAQTNTYWITMEGQPEDYAVTFEKISRAVEKYNNSKID